MAIKKLPKNKLGRSALYYRNNPESYQKKLANDKKINAKPEQRAKRSELKVAREQKIRNGANLDGKDLAHTKNGLVPKSIKANRGNKSDSKGDRKARGGEKK